MWTWKKSTVPIPQKSSSNLFKLLLCQILLFMNMSYSLHNLPRIQLLFTIFTATTLIQATVIFCLDYCIILVFPFSFHLYTSLFSTQQVACHSSPQTPLPRIKAKVLITAYDALYYPTLTLFPSYLPFPSLPPDVPGTHQACSCHSALHLLPLPGKQLFQAFTCLAP